MNEKFDNDSHYDSDENSDEEHFIKILNRSEIQFLAVQGNLNTLYDLIDQLNSEVVGLDVIKQLVQYTNEIVFILEQFADELPDMVVEDGENLMYGLTQSALILGGESVLLKEQVEKYSEDTLFTKKIIKGKILELVKSIDEYINTIDTIKKSLE